MKIMIINDVSNSHDYYYTFSLNDDIFSANPPLSFSNSSDLLLFVSSNYNSIIIFISNSNSNSSSSKYQKHAIYIHYQNLI